MKRTIPILLAALCCLSVMPPPLLAHHGTARFDMSHIVTMQGTVTEFRWGSPHCYIHADVKDAQGKVRNWLLEAGSPLMLARFRWDKNSVKPGDRVTLYGFSAKDGSAYMHLERIEFPDGRALVGFP